jgi:hypothetical protein
LLRRQTWKSSRQAGGVRLRSVTPERAVGAGQAAQRMTGRVGRGQPWISGPFCHAGGMISIGRIQSDSVGLAEDGAVRELRMTSCEQGMESCVTPGGRWPKASGFEDWMGAGDTGRPATRSRREPPALILPVRSSPSFLPRSLFSHGEALATSSDIAGDSPLRPGQVITSAANEWSAGLGACSASPDWFAEVN